MNLEQVIGRPPERLTIDERQALTGKWYAMEVYSPDTLPLRRIEAIGDSIDDCVRQLKARGLDPRKFEFQPVMPAY